jgi:hypothetical protein
MTKELLLSRVRYEVLHTLLMHAPDRWPDERLDAVEAKVMLDTRNRLDGFAPEEVLESTLEQQIWIAVSQTKDFIYRRQVWS